MYIKINSLFLFKIGKLGNSGERNFSFLFLKLFHKAPFKKIKELWASQANFLKNKLPLKAHRTLWFADHHKLQYIYCNFKLGPFSPCGPLTAYCPLLKTLMLSINELQFRDYFLVFLVSTFILKLQIFFC